jgi:AAA15 family ATPase/GTPase
MCDHCIREINIADYKLFHNFTAKGFGRVNLVGGKNNAGKTAFLEALFLISGYARSPLLQKSGLNEEERQKLYFHIIKLLLAIEKNRKGLDFIRTWMTESVNLASFNDFAIELPKKVKLSAENNYVQPDEFMKYNYGNHGIFQLSQFRKNKYFYKLEENGKLQPNLEIFNFLTMCNNDQYNTRRLLGIIKKQDKNEFVNSYLKTIFNVDKIDLTDDEVILIKKGNAFNLSEFGDGIKSFVNIILSLLYQKNYILFIDEIENGIHHTNFDKLWEIILTISKEQNVQVFATTHSKEMIESYSKVAKKLKNDEIAFVELGRNKNGDIRAVVMDHERFHRELDASNEVRGW